MRRAKLSQIYVRYVIKSPYLFYSFVLVGCALFSLITLATKIDVVETYDAQFSNNKVIIHERIDYPITKVYMYKSRGVKVTQCFIDRVEYCDNQYIVIYFDEAVIDRELEGNIKIDVVKKQCSLLNVILGLEDKYIPENKRE